MRSNTVKSILTLHDPRRLPEGNIVRQEAVSGGLPCFSRDLPINVVKTDISRCFSEIQAQ